METPNYLPEEGTGCQLTSYLLHTSSQRAKLQSKHSIAEVLLKKTAVQQSGINLPNIVILLILHSCMCEKKDGALLSGSPLPSDIFN